MEIYKIENPAYFLKIDGDDIGIEMSDLVEELKDNDVSDVFVSNEDFDKIEHYYKDVGYIRENDIKETKSFIVSVYETFHGTINITTIK